MESEREQWEKTKMQLIRQLFQGTAESSPIHEGTDAEGASAASSSLSPVHSITIQQPPHQEEKGDENSSLSDDCGSYPLIIEREPNRHDEPKEFYQELMVRMRKAYRIMFCQNDSAESSHLPSSSGGTQSLRTERLNSGERITPRDASSGPILSREDGCSDSPMPHDNSDSKQKIDSDGDTRSRCSNSETVHPQEEECSDSSEHSNESSRSFCFVPTSRRARALRGRSHAGVQKKDQNKDNKNTAAAGSDKSDSNECTEPMRTASGDSVVDSRRDSSNVSASTRDESDGTLSVECERELIPSAELTFDSTSSIIITSTPTHFDMAVNQNLDFDDIEEPNKRKMEDTRAGKRKCARSALQTSFEKSKKKKYF